MIKIANAPCSWGVDYADDINNPKWEDVFKDISKAGYKYCEIGPYGFLPNDSNKTLDFLIKMKLKVVGGFIFDHLHNSSEHSRIRSKIISTCIFLKELKANVFVIIDHISQKRMQTSGNRNNSISLPLDEYKTMINFLNDICNLVKEEYDLIPVIHPHAGTYIEYDDEIDKIINDVNNNYLSLCLDTAHLKYSGIDPYAAILKYQKLVRHMHFKDINAEVLQNVHLNNLDFDTAVSKGVFTPLGNGLIDFKKIYKNLNSIGYEGYATIEQDIDPTKGLKAIDYARESLRFLNQFKN